MNRNTIYGAICASAIATAALATPPANDTCGNPTVINGYELHDYVDTSAATVQACEALSDCDSPELESHSVWYRITAPQSGILDISTYTEFNSVVAVFNGCALPTQFGCVQPTCLECELGYTDSWSYAEAYIYDLVVEEGETYLIKVASKSRVGGWAYVDICLHPFLAHDQPENAKTITGIEFSEFIDTIGAHTDDCEANVYIPCAVAELDNAVWYRYTAPVDGIAVVHTDGSEYETVLGAYDALPIEGLGGICNVVAEITCDNESGSFSSLLVISMQAGQTRWFRVDADWDYWFSSPIFGYPSNLAFNFGFLPTGTPPNDTCATATLITTNSFNPPLLPIDQASASSNEPNENCETLAFGVSNSVFYKFTAPANGTASVNTFGSDYDTVLSVFNGCGTITLGGYLQPTLLECNNDAGGLFSPASALSVDINAGDTIVIKVADNGSSPGSGLLDFNFTFTPAAACPADLANGDGIVNGADLSVLFGSWGGRGAGDLNGDGVVNAADLSILLGAWGACP